jgi:hypothetical protein
MTNVFLSYAREDDEAFVKRLYHALKARGFDVWWDRTDMSSRGLSFHQEILARIASVDRFVLVVGPKVRNSEYVEQEWKSAIEHHKVVTPILRLGDVSHVPDKLRLFHHEDFREDAQFDFHLDNLVRQLSEAPPTLGKLIAVPSLPPHYLERSERLESLRNALRADLDRAVVISGTAARIGMHGMGGIGKSLLAASVAHDRKIREAFPDGIYWIPLGLKPNLEELQLKLYLDQGGDGGFPTAEEGKRKLKELLFNKWVLLILDDAWDSKHVDAFDVLGPHCRAMITTRNAGLLADHVGVHHRVELLSDNEALRILAKSAGDKAEQLSEEASKQLIAECGRLPLAVALCGGMILNNISWKKVLGALREHDLEHISLEHRDANQSSTADDRSIDPTRNLWKTMEVSLQTLTEAEQQRFAELAVFPNDEAVPEAAVFTLWADTANMSALEAETLLVKFELRSLVQVDRPPPASGQSGARVSLHDLLFDFSARLAGRLFGNEKTLHRKIVEAYAKQCRDGWSTGPTDGYFFSHLGQHLIAAERETDLAQLLLDLRWREAMIEAGLVFQLADDIASVFKKLATGDSRQHLLAMLDKEGRFGRTAMTRMTIRALAAIAKHEPHEVTRLVMRMVEPQTRLGFPIRQVLALLTFPLRIIQRLIFKRDVTAAQADIQAARVALEVAMISCSVDSMKDAVRQVILAACARSDSTIRSLAMIAFIRLMQNRANYDFGLGILQELAHRCVTFGVIRLRRLEVFVGCSLALFFERSDNAELVAKLKQMAGGVVGRVWGLKLGLWLAPKVMEALFTSVSDDFNPANLPEVHSWKKFAASHPELVAANLKMIQFIDPGRGSSDEFLAAFAEFRKLAWPPESWFAMFACSCALIARALSGDDAALEANYEFWKSVPPHHMARQDFMYRMRLIQVGRKLHPEQPPLEPEWTNRVEVALRDFMREQHGVVKGSPFVRGWFSRLVRACTWWRRDSRASQPVYALTGAPFGMVFLAHQLGHGRIPILGELIAWSAAGENGKMRRLSEEPEPKRQPDMLLLKLLEFVGAEIGANDQLSRATAFHGISCFLEHASKFEEEVHWEQLAIILSRMSHFAVEAVDEFLAKLSSDHRDKLRLRMSKIMPKEGLGSILGGTRSELFFASVYRHRSGEQGGPMKAWQDFLRRCNDPERLSATLRFAAQRELQLLLQTSQPPLT